jgi:hypothetical protein
LRRDRFRSTDISSSDRKHSDATPEPKLVVGDCGAAGGIFGCSYASAVANVVPVDVAAPGCAGQKVFTLQTVPAKSPEEQRKGVAQAAGFSLHAGIGIEADARGHGKPAGRDYPRTWSQFMDWFADEESC